MPKKGQTREAGYRAMPVSAIPPDLPGIMEGAAQVLKAHGCGDTLILAALLSLCGVRVCEISLPTLRLWQRKS